MMILIHRLLEQFPFINNEDKSFRNIHESIDCLAYFRQNRSHIIEIYDETTNKYTHIAKILCLHFRRSVHEKKKIVQSRRC